MLPNTENLVGANAVFTQSYTAGIIGKSPTRLIAATMAALSASAAVGAKYQPFMLVAYNSTANVWGDYSAAAGSAAWQKVVAGVIWDDDFTPAATIPSNQKIRIIYGDCTFEFSALNKADGTAITAADLATIGGRIEGNNQAAYIA
jgi:hypothetical protein